jgi:iron complex outermembrane receptor protein
MKVIKYIFVFSLLIILLKTNLYSQQVTKHVSEMTKEELLELSYDDLLALPFEELIQAADKMEMSADELIEFFLNKDVTSASKRAEKSLNSPLSTTVLSRDEIINSGATSIPEALRLVPGMIVREKTAGNYDVHIRGNDNLPPKGMFVYSENSISLIMIDGRPVYNYAFGGTFWETLPIDLNDVERIEVIRGPSSALYGPNAVSGAINIITRSVESKKVHTDGQVQIGTNNSKLANGSVSFGISDKLKFRFSGNYTRFDRFSEGYYVFDLDSTLSAKDMETLKQYWKPGRTNFFVEENFNEKFPDVKLATEKFAGNAFISYKVSQKMGIDLAGGMQNSNIVSNTLGNNDIPIIGRTSKTGYFDLRAHAYNFQAQVNYLKGDQFVQKEYQGWHIEPEALNASLEYEHTIGTLVLRPGISYQRAIYDDSKWGNAELKDGFINGPKNLNSFAYYLRVDYKILEKLRLIAALRGDKYNKPDINKFTYQFITTYDINENNVIRAGYSRANRGPFIADTYSDYYWQIIPGYYTLHYCGNQDLKLPTMDMVELGYRTKIFKKVMVEFEAFHTIIKDMSLFTPDTMTLYFNLAPIIFRGQDPRATPPYQITGHGEYKNLDMISTQDGITCNVSVILNSKLNFKIFGTFQQTKLKNFYPRTIWQDFTYLQNAAGAQMGNDLLLIQGGQASPFDTMKVYTSSYSISKDSLVSLDHKSTPSFYGGLIVEYKPIKKLIINSTVYFYSQQTFLHNKLNDIGRYSDTYINNQAAYNPEDFTDRYTIEPKFILNLTVTYKFWKENSVFFNARNILNNDQNEFAYMDKVKGLYLIGLNFNF